MNTGFLYGQHLTLKANYFFVPIFEISNKQFGVEYQKSNNKGYYFQYVRANLNSIFSIYQACSTTYKVGVNTPLDKRRFPIFVNVGLAYKRTERNTAYGDSKIDNIEGYLDDFGFNIGCGKKHRLIKNLYFETILGLYPRLTDGRDKITYPDETQAIQYDELRWEVSPYMNCSFTYSFKLN